MKICTKCNLNKQLEDFENGRNQCKDCRKFLKKKYYDDNKERVLSKCEKYRKNNKEKIKESDHNNYEKNKDKIKERVKNYRLNNIEKVKDRKKKYYEANKDVILAKNKLNEDKKIKRKEYDNKNRESKNEYQKLYFKNRRENDPIFKLSNNLRGLINISIKNNGHKKKSKTKDMLGCSFEEFKIYLESKFESWMSWENYGKYNGELNYGWDIDHIIPSSSAKTEEELLKLNHYTNLQPLCSYTNRYIKSNNIFN